MDVDELLKAVQNTVVTQEMKDALVKRLKEAEERFEEEARQRMPTEEFLNRQYTI